MNKCTHTNAREYSWEWDSGYGRQEWKTGLQCLDCGCKNSWPGMSQNWWFDEDAYYTPFNKIKYLSVQNDCPVMVVDEESKEIASDWLKEQGII